MTGREFDPTQAGGPIRRLSTGHIKVTDRGIDAVERHIGRFGTDQANQVMVDRLCRIAKGEIEPTHYDLNYYAHELRSPSDTAAKDSRREPETITTFGTTPIRPP